LLHSRQAENPTVPSERPNPEARGCAMKTPVRQIAGDLGFGLPPIFPAHFKPTQV
jgi:hypothetical protein